MNKWLELMIGLVVVIGTILIGYYSWIGNWALWGFSLDFMDAAWTVFKGGLWWFVLGIGILFILLGLSDLKE